MNCRVEDSHAKSHLRVHWSDASPRVRIQLLAAAMLLIGGASVCLEGVVFRGLRRDVELALFPSDGVLVTAQPLEVRVVPEPPETVIEAHTAIVLPMVQTPAPALESAASTAAPTPSPPPTFASEVERMCYYSRDVGIIADILASRKQFCQPTEAASNSESRTSVTFVDLESQGNIQMRAMVFDRDFQLDFTRATINRPIASLAQDGGDHDPRFDWTNNMISCGCSAFQQYAADFYRASGNRATLRPWDPTLAGTYETIDEPSTVCGKPGESAFKTQPPAMRTPPPVVITDKAIVITRRDDHNPFFQISSALNAWLMMRALGWSREETRVIHMDGGYKSPIDELHHSLLSTPSKFTLLRGGEHLMGQKFKFTNQVMISPYETTGPLMQHLNDEEPCQQSRLLKEFRADALQAMNVRARRDNAKPIVVTVITRRNYGGRRVQRKWKNEAEVLHAMRQEYPSFNGVPIVIQSVEFVDLTLQQQMNIALNSDVVIGMHGAGMVNVLWTKPGTLVVEIFPRNRYRWGYRNICQYVGCDWHEFRGGKDTGAGDNASDKTIPVDTWLTFFDPLFRHHIGMPPKVTSPSPPFDTPAAAPTEAATAHPVATAWKAVDDAQEQVPTDQPDWLVGRGLRSTKN